MQQIEICVTSRKFTIVFFPFLQEQISVFAMNGFGDLQSFCEIREADLDYMGIMAPEQRAKILAAVQVMHDYQCKCKTIALSSRKRVISQRCKGKRLCKRVRQHIFFFFFCQKCR